MQFVEIKDLKPGMRLAKPIYNKMGVMLYDRNSFLTMSGIKSIENFGLIGLFTLEPAEPLPPVSQEDLAFEQFQVIYMFRIKEIMEQLQQGKDPVGLPALTADILKNFGSVDHKLNFIQTLRSSADFVYKHSICTAILSAMTANILNFNATEKNILVTSALLYDLGYLYVPRTILEKDTLTDEDLHIIQECRKKGFLLLNPDTNKYMLHSEVLNTIQQTLTMLSATDPAELKEKKFSKLAHVIMVTDKFNQLTAMNLHHVPLSEMTAIKRLKAAPEFYQPKTVSALSSSIHILASGCSIDLSNGDKGIVLMENPMNFLAPVVLNIRDNQVYDLSDPKISETIQIADIMKTMDNRIVVDEQTLQQFSSDSKLQSTLVRFKQKMREKTQNTQA